MFLVSVTLLWEPRWIQSTGSIANSAKKASSRPEIKTVSSSMAFSREPTANFLGENRRWLLSLAYDKRRIQFTSRNGLLFQFRAGSGKNRVPLLSYAWMMIVNLLNCGVGISANCKAIVC